MWFAQLLELAQRRAAGRVEGLRARFPQASRRELGERLVRSGALRAGLLGAATGTLALIALPIGLPAGVAVTLLLEAELLFALIALYGLSVRGPAGRLRLYALWAGAGFADAAKGAGLRLGASSRGSTRSCCAPSSAASVSAGSLAPSRCGPCSALRSVSRWTAPPCARSASPRLTCSIAGRNSATSL